MDPSSRDIIFPEPVQSNIQQCNLPASFDFTESAISQFQSHEASEVTSSSNLHEQEPLILPDEDFLEMDDLLGSEPDFEDPEKSVLNFQFDEIDGLSELDLFQDAGMFLNEMGPTDQATISHPYVNSLEENMVTQFDDQLQANATGASLVNNQMYQGDVGPINNQIYSDSGHINSQLYPDGVEQISNQFHPDVSAQIDNQLWADVQGINNYTSAEGNYDSLLNPSSGTLICAVSLQCFLNSYNY